MTETVILRSTVDGSDHEVRILARDTDGTIRVMDAYEADIGHREAEVAAMDMLAPDTWELIYQGFGYYLPADRPLDGEAFKVVG